MIPFMRNGFINKPMRPGFKLPDYLVKDLVPPEDTTVEDGFAALRTALSEYESTDNLRPHSLLGPLSREDWDQFTLRHAELHLSFVVPETG